MDFLYFTLVVLLYFAFFTVWWICCYFSSLRYSFKFLLCLCVCDGYMHAMAHMAKSEDCPVTWFFLSISMKVLGIELWSSGFCGEHFYPMIYCSSPALPVLICPSLHTCGTGQELWSWLLKQKSEVTGSQFHSVWPLHHGTSLQWPWVFS